MSWQKISFGVVGVLLLAGIGLYWYIVEYAEFDIYVPTFADQCADCHGSDLAGTANGVTLIGERQLRGSDSVASLVQSIRYGHPSLGTPAFANELTDLEVKGLAIFVAERQLGQRFLDFRFDWDMVVPTAVQHTEGQDFTFEVLVQDLDPMVFSIEPLPDGNWLLTEKERGLSIVSAQGVQSALIEDTPKTGSSMDILGIQYGVGWLLDVAIHPDYARNGWVYLHYTDLCPTGCDDEDSSWVDQSMNRLDRGRIVDGRWTDVETIWQAPVAFYNNTPDTGAGGRIAFDDSGHVYISVGIKDSAEGTSSDISAQDLASPYGKIHRVNTDGSIPADNPFAQQTLWTYGHRSPQGLEWNPERRLIWNAEMGPRGGDELNELLPGRNYGWPFHSLGLEYTGSHVERHKGRVVEFDVADVEQTLVDITPSPAISSFVFYEGDRFDNWQGNVLIGSLKGSSLFRMVFDGNRLVHRETLFKDLARIRDVEVGYDGLVYLLLENKHGSAIVRMVPVESVN